MTDSTPGPHTSGAPAELVNTFTELAQIVYAGNGTDDVFDNVCRLAPLVVPGCDHATLTVWRDGRLHTTAANDEVGREIDRAEHELQDGPCVDASTDEAAQYVPDLTADGPWPELRAWILANTPVRGAMAYRLLVDETKVGALNLFADTAGALTTASADTAAIVAAFTSVAAAAANHRQQAEDLRAGLRSNREIGKAIGLLMAFHHITDDEALEVLRRHSQETNVKLATVARGLLDYHNRR